jgi:hypothetical protein
MGIEVKSFNQGIVLTQEKYARDFLERVGLKSCKALPTPLSASKTFSHRRRTPWTRRLYKVQKYSWSPLILDTHYGRHCFFSEQNMSISSCTHHYTLDSCQENTKHASGKVELGLTFKKSSSTLMSAFLDADWVGCVDDRRST